MELVVGLSPASRRTHLELLSRKDLQNLAKACNLKANLKTHVLVDNITTHLATLPAALPSGSRLESGTQGKRKPASISNDLSPAPANAMYDASAQPSIPAVLQGTPINPLYAGGARGRNGVQPSASRRRTSGSWVASRQAELGQLMTELTKINSVKKAGVRPRSSGATKLAPEVIASTKAQDVKAVQNASLSGRRAAGPAKPQPANRPQSTKKGRVMPTGATTAARKAGPGMPAKVQLPRAAGGVTKPALKKSAEPQQRQGGVKKTVPGGGAYASDRAQKAADAFAARMKKAQEARMGKKL